MATYPVQALCSVQPAKLEERMKAMQLEEIRWQIEEDSSADSQCQQLDAKAKEAQRLREEATQAREALVKRLDRRHRLVKTENEWKIVKIVTSMLEEENIEAPNIAVTTDCCDCSSQAVQAEDVPAFTLTHDQPNSCEVPGLTSTPAHGASPQTHPEASPTAQLNTPAPRLRGVSTHSNANVRRLFPTSETLEDGAASQICFLWRNTCSPCRQLSICHSFHL